MVYGVYEDILEALKEFNTSLGTQNYGNMVVNETKTNTTYPYTVFEEISNDPYQRTNIKLLDSVDNLGYELTVYAKTKGKIEKIQMARELAKKLGDFLVNTVGLKEMSANPLPNVNDDSIFRYVVRYTAKYNEYRAKIL